MSPSLLSSGHSFYKKFDAGKIDSKLFDEEKEKHFNFQQMDFEYEETQQEAPDKEDSVDMEVLQNTFETWLFNSR